MNRFVKVQIYCKAKQCCFSDIKESKKPHIVINIDDISSLEPHTTWGLCEGHWNYPYRELNMNNGDSYLLVLESANKLEEEMMHINDIDWEQRRYEIAKDIMAASCIRPGVLCTNQVTDLADVLIAELKKKQYYVM